MLFPSAPTCRTRRPAASCATHVRGIWSPVSCFRFRRRAAPRKNTPTRPTSRSQSSPPVARRSMTRSARKGLPSCKGPVGCPASACSASRTISTTCAASSRRMRICCSTGVRARPPCISRIATKYGSARKGRFSRRRIRRWSRDSPVSIRCAGWRVFRAISWAPTSFDHRHWRSILRSVLWRPATTVVMNCWPVRRAPRVIRGMAARRVRRISCDS